MWCDVLWVGSASRDHARTLSHTLLHAQSPTHTTEHMRALSLRIFFFFCQFFLLSCGLAGLQVETDGWFNNSVNIAHSLITHQVPLDPNPDPNPNPSIPNPASEPQPPKPELEGQTLKLEPVALKPSR